MKKVLSLVLVIAMVLSSMSFAFAAKFEDIADTDYAKAIETLTALGVVTGYEDGTFRPENVVTRAEMAKLIVEILGYGDLVAGSKSNFADTQGHWADPWIALAAGRGLVIGTGDGKFTPDRQVSYDEAITMIVRALGYTDASNELKNMTWPTNFKVKAAELGLTKDVGLKQTGADRGGVAQLLYNALEAVLVTVNSDGDVVKSTDELLSRLAELDDDFTVTTEKLNPNNKNYAGDLVDLAPYMFQNLKVYLNDDDEVVYVKGSNSLVLEGVVDEITTTSSTTVIAVEKANEKVTKVTLNTSGSGIDADMVFENGSLRENVKLFFGANGLENTDTIKIVATDAGAKDGKIQGDEVVGFVTTNQTKVVRIEQEYVEGKAKIDRIALPNDDGEVDLDNITVKGEVDALEDIEVDDIVVEYLSEDDTVTTLVVTRETIEGKVNRTDGDYRYVNGTKYSVNAKAGLTIDLGDEGVFYLDHDGKIAGVDTEVTGPTNYAVVVAEPAGGVAKARFGYSIDTYPQLKLATQDGETVIYDIQVKMNSKGHVSGSAKAGDTPIITANSVDAANEGDASDKLAIASGTVGVYDLIKYSLNADGRISKVTVVEPNVKATVAALGTGDEIDLSKTNNKLASNAVIFDATDDDFDVVDSDTLPTEVLAYIERNSSGQIIVLVAADGEVGSTVTQFAYITKINDGYNDDGDEVKVVELYIDGVKKTVYTTTDIEQYENDGNTVATAFNSKEVFQVKFDGSDLDYTREIPNASQVTALAINASAGMIKLGANWEVVAEDATILGIDIDKDYGDRRVTDFRDLYDITKGSTLFEVYMNSDDEICLILIRE